MEPKKDRMFIHNEDAFSSNIDSMIFLMLISISAIILMPAVMAEYQYRSAGYVSLQDTDTLLLSSILNSRSDEAGYTYRPGEIVGLNLSLPPGSMLRDAEETLYERQQKHRTFADLVAEDLILGIAVSENGSKTYLNPMAKMHRPMTEDAIGNYLDTRIGGRYHYRFEAHWYPVRGYSTGSDIEIGRPAPADAFRQKARISLPLVSSSSHDEFTESMNTTAFWHAVNSPDPSSRLHEGYNRSIETVSTSAAETITSTIFPADYLRTLSSIQSSRKSEQLSLISSPADSDVQDPEFAVALHSINYTVNGVFGQNVNIPLEDQKIGMHMVDAVGNSLIHSNSAMISAHLKREMQPEIESTISGILNSTDPSVMLELHDRQMRSIYSRANNEGADIILFLWQ
jgi:hypothetical protein